MGRIRLDTLVDFSKHGYDLDIFCRTCGHKAILTPETFFARGIAGSIEKLERKLRCEKCRARNAVITATCFGPSGGVRKARSWQDAWKRG